MKAILPDKSEVSAQRIGERYYGSGDISPDIAFVHGVPIKGNDRRLVEHILGNPDSAFRGTTAQPASSPGKKHGAAYWTTSGGWVYHIGPMRGWDVEQLLEGRIPKPGGFGPVPHGEELESSVPARIEPDKIIKAGRVEPLREHLVVRAWTYNRNYRPS